MGKILTIFAVFCVAQTLAAAAGAADLPSADRYFILPKSVEAHDRTIPPSLDRELLRQAMLLAARDDMGLFTRDEGLGEAAPRIQADWETRRISLNISIPERYGKQLHLQFQAPNQPPVLFDIPVPPLKSDEFSNLFMPDLAKLAAEAEKLSHSTFADWLTLPALENQPHVPSPKRESEAEISKA